MGFLFVIVVVALLAGIISAAVQGSDNSNINNTAGNIRNSSYRQSILPEVKYGTGCTSPDFRTHIAGVNYRCGGNDIGGFVGVAVPESGNQHDRNAVAIYRNDGKHLGYIPKDRAREFRTWCHSQAVPCVGYITRGDEGMLRGGVKALDNADEEYAKGEIRSYIGWLSDKFGTEYIPEGYDDTK